MDQQKEMIEQYIQAYNQFDIEGMTRNLHQDIVFEHVSEDNVALRSEGIEEFTQQAETAKENFTFRNQAIARWDMQLYKIVVSIEYEAILAKDLPNGMKAGDVLQLTGQSEFEFKDNKIVKITDCS